MQIQQLTKNDMIEYGILIAIIATFIIVDSSYFRAVTDSLVGRIFLFSSVVYTYYKKGTQSAVIMSVLIAILMLNLTMEEDVPVGHETTVEGMKDGESDEASGDEDGESHKENKESQKSETVATETDANGDDISSGEEVKDFQPDLIALEHILQRTATAPSE